MGEYATLKSTGQRIKIGTCEDMFYLRHDQRHDVNAESGNVNPITDAAEIRFRFPFPDEDQIAPGEFENYGRKMFVDGLTPSPQVEHYSLQFSAEGGYLVSLPCPEAGPIHLIDSDGVSKELRVARNNFPGRVFLQQQRYRPGIGLVPVLCCACGSAWRIEERHEIEELATRFRCMADKDTSDARSKNWHIIADRILAGISDETRTICDFEHQPSKKGGA